MYFVKDTIKGKQAPGRPRIELYNKVLQMRQEGFIYDSISIMLNIHRQTIASICQLHKLGGRIR